MARQWNENAREAWVTIMYKYDVPEEKQEILNEVTNMWNTLWIKDTSQDYDICFNELYILDLKFRKIKEKYEKDEDEMKTHVFDVFP